MLTDKRYVKYGIIAACVLLLVAVVALTQAPSADKGQGDAGTASTEATGSESDKSEAKDEKADGKTSTEKKDEKVDKSKENAGAKGAPTDANARKPKTEAARTAVRQMLEGYDTSVAVSMVPLDGTKGFSVNGQKQFASASMIKLLILATLLEDVERGSVSLDETYVLDSADIVGGTGHINEFSLGTEFTYDELAESMIAYSDNTATNVLIDVLGMDAVNAEAEALGLHETSLGRKMMDFDSSFENYMSTRDASIILRGFAKGTIASKELSERAVGYLSKQTDNDALARGIPEGVTFAHKTGTLTMARHDGGIVYAEDPYILVVFTELNDGAANDLMAQISQTVYETTQG